MKDLNRIEAINVELTAREREVRNFLIDAIKSNPTWCEDADFEKNDDLLSFIECSIALDEPTESDDEFDAAANEPLTCKPNTGNITYNEAIDFLCKFNLMPL